jgi:glycosyltransferase involved in cell wall biosynthesis
MRVVVTLPWGERLGGAEAMLQAILDGARESGHELELVFLQGGPWPDELIDAGFRVEVIPAGHLRQAHRWLATVVRLTAILRRRKPDLILNWAAKTQLYGAPAAVLAGMSGRVVWWQQGIPDGYWLDRCATLLPARAIGCYSHAAARAQERLRPHRETFVVAAGAPAPGLPAPGPNGRCPIELALPPNVPVVGIVGRLQPWKGQDRLLRAQALLHERGHDVHLVIVGGDAYGLSTEYAESLPALVSRLGLTGAVTLTGQVPDAGPYIEQLDVLVNASDPEPFGIVLLEGMARGVPVVAVDSGGPAEFIEDGKTGVLARSGEPGALADALEALLASPEPRRAIGQAGRERFLAEFTDAALRERFFHHLEALVADGGACEVTIVAHDVGSVGGMERQLAELAIGLRGLGHEVTVIAWTCELPSDVGVAFHRVRGPRRPFLLGYPSFMVAGSLAVRRRRRGVVQATGAIVLNRVDSVAIHCCHQVYRAAPRRSTRLLRWYVQLLGVVKRGAERACVRANRSATFVCVSDGVAGEMREHYPQAADRILTIHNGVDTRAFAPGAHEREALALRARLGIPAEHLIAAFVARGWGHKGLGSAIEALTQAPDWDLVVAGAGDRLHYQELADSLGVSGRVHWLGVVGDIHVVYELADAFVLPSSYETFSLVTFEAAASGLPLLATAVSGVCELLVDGETGFVITPEPSVIAGRLNQLAADPADRERLGRAARQAALAFSWEEMVAEHHELYTRLANDR